MVHNSNQVYSNSGTNLCSSVPGILSSEEGTEKDMMEEEIYVTVGNVQIDAYATLSGLLAGFAIILALLSITQ